MEKGFHPRRRISDEILPGDDVGHLVRVTMRPRIHYLCLNLQNDGEVKSSVPGPPDMKGGPLGRAESLPSSFSDSYGKIVGSGPDV